MADDLALAGLDAPRALPPALRERLEVALLAAAGAGSGMAGASDTLDLTDHPEPARSEDEHALDAPRPLPVDVRGRLESAVLSATGARPADASRVATWSRPLLAVAAVLALLLGSAALLNLDTGSERDITAAGPEATTSTTPAVAGPEVGIPSPTTGVPAEVPPTSRPSPPGRTAPPTTVPSTAPAGELASPAGGGDSEPAPSPEGTGTGPEAQDPGPPPPFASPSSPAASSDQAPAAMAPSAPGSQGGASPQPAPPASATRASGPALRVGIVGGDAAQEAGFDAYVALLNRDGGVRGRPVETVRVGPGAADPSTLVTVNLSPRPLATPGGAPDWAGGALLETLTATEDLLPAGGRVFSFASVPERQAHLAVDAVFPEAAPGARAVIWAATDGPYAGKVAEAFRQTLAGKGVQATIRVYDPAKPPPLLPTAAEDAAFVSLDPPAAAAFAHQAKENNYRPARGIAGVASLFDPAVAADLPDGARVVSPYVVPGGAEGDAIRSGAGSTSAGTLHGWATAKVLAVALWRTGADSPEEALAALEGMAGYDSGLAPPYETRPETRSRTPEGVVFEVRSGAFAAQGTFRRDPY
jgi:ABC-type branched-subunit amino acid transport system substrate-binding protein